MELIVNVLYESRDGRTARVISRVSNMCWIEFTNDRSRMLIPISGRVSPTWESDSDLLKPVLYDSRVIQFDPNKRRNKSCRDYWLSRAKTKREAAELAKRRKGNKLLTDMLKKGG